jgi:hypothetical protein
VGVWNFSDPETHVCSSPQASKSRTCASTACMQPGPVVCRPAAGPTPVAPAPAIIALPPLATCTTLAHNSPHNSGGRRSAWSYMVISRRSQSCSSRFERHRTAAARSTARGAHSGLGAVHSAPSSRPLYVCMPANATITSVPTRLPPCPTLSQAAARERP